MCAAGHVGFLPENTHLMYLNFPCMPPLSTSQYKSTKSVRPKLWLHLEFNQQDKYPKPFRLLQFREDQRTDAGVFLMWFINILQCQQTHKVLIPWLQQVSNKWESFPLQGGFFHATFTHTCFSSVPWSLAWLLCEGGISPPSYSHRVSQHMADQLRDSIPSSLQAPNLHFGDLFGFFRESPCSFCAGAQLLWQCCVAASQHPTSPHVQNRKIFSNAAVLGQSHWLGSHMTGWTAI